MHPLIYASCFFIALVTIFAQAEDIEIYQPIIAAEQLGLECDRSVIGDDLIPTVASKVFEHKKYQNELYFTEFRPSAISGWQGNLKRKNLMAEQGTSNLVDAASNLSEQRNLYTNLLNSSEFISSANRITEENGYITAALLQADQPLNDQQRINVLQWARGLNLTTQAARKTMADSLHSTAVVVSYQEQDKQERVVFLGTNLGVLHAFSSKPNSLNEFWAFLPKELLPNLTIYQQGASGEKAYGLDGPITLYHQDTNNDRLINVGEKAYLAIGMRRGGRNYYLLDISRRTNPKIIAQIKGGEGDFKELGQSWSKIIPAKVRWNGSVIPVYFFAGGYEPREDGFTTRTPHQQGNAIFMVAADNTLTGKSPFDLLWKLSGPSSFAADLTLIDNNGEGTVDLIYAADVGGRLWRIDIGGANTPLSDFASASILADLNDGTTAGNIRFYNRPDVSYSTHGQAHYQLAIGSGFRAKPQDKNVIDKIFVINDYAVHGRPVNSRPSITLASLARLSNGEEIENEQFKQGFYYELPGAGEKILNATITFNHKVYAVSYLPPTESSGPSCEADVGSARLIVIATAPSVNSEVPNISTRILGETWIASSLALNFAENGDDANQSQVIMSSGQQVLTLEDDFKRLRKRYWRER